LPSASPSIEIVTMSPGMQWTVCGALRPSFSAISSPSPSITSLIRGAAGSETSSMWMRPERKPGTISVSRCSEEWQAEEQAFQPKWWSSSPTLGMSTRPTISPYLAEAGSTSITATKSGASIPVPSYSAAT
jgi:hypothetical protein